MLKKTVFLRILTMLILTVVILQTTLLAAECREVKDKVVRLHILAQSDSAKDQLVKLRVRDALLARADFTGLKGTDPDTAVKTLRRQLPALQKTAEAELKKLQVPQTVTCRIAPAQFPTRCYDGVTLPAGEYTALQVILGEGKGHNWWCVMFPPLCLAAAADREELLTATLSPGGCYLVGSGDITVKFKAVELVESVIGRLKG